MHASNAQMLTASILFLAAVLLSWRCYLLRLALRSLRTEYDNVLGRERQRIAADIHDDLGQNLLILKLDIAALRQAMQHGYDPTLPTQLEHMAAHTDLASRSLRTIINGLRPVALEQGLRCAVERQLHEFSRANGIAFKLEDACYHSDGAGPAEATVLRVLQESLSNIARHSEATEVRIALARDERELSLTVHDNGVGLPCGQLRRGLGLAGMERRVADAGGWLALASTPGHGTALTVAVPNRSKSNAPGFSTPGLAPHQTCE